MPKGGTKKVPPQNDAVLLEPSLLALRRHLSTQQLPEVSVRLQLAETHPLPAEATQTVQLRGAGAPSDGSTSVRVDVLQRSSAYYRHAASFGAPPAEVQLESGHRGVRLLAEALSSGSLALGPGTLPDLLQAASYLQVAAVLDAAAAYLQRHALPLLPGPVLRVALDLGLAELAGHVERDLLEDFYMHSGERAAALLKEWPAARRRELLGSPRLCAPTECCVVETLCHLAKHASSAEATSLLCCVRFELMSQHELAAAALYIQHNSKWVDRRLSTLLAWRLLNARLAADLGLAADGRTGADAAGAAATTLVGGGVRFGGAVQLGAQLGGGEAAAAAEAAARPARRRTLHWGLTTARLAAWSGTAMYCASRRIPCSFQAASGGRPMVLQLEREDPRHAAAEAVGGVKGSAGAASAGGSGWDVQISVDPDKFPPGFQATCFAFGAAGFYWCKLGPLAKAGPTWWKVGFLASQLPSALPTALLAGRSGGLEAGGWGGLEGSGDGLLLVGWWVPEQ